MNRSRVGRRNKRRRRDVAVLESRVPLSSKNLSIEGSGANFSSRGVKTERQVDVILSTAALR